MKNKSLEQIIRPPGWPNPTHDWLSTVEVVYTSDYQDPFVDQFIQDLTSAFKSHGHTIAEKVSDSTDLILTSTAFGEAINWRKALMFTGRRTFGLSKQPMVVSVLRATEAQLEELLSQLDAALQHDGPQSVDYDYPGITKVAYRTLYEQGIRGGPIMSLARLVQSQAKCIRIILLVGEANPDFAYVFDLVGAHPRIEATDPDYFIKDIMLRLVTSLSTSEITDHRVEHPPIPRKVWDQLKTPQEMREAAAELGKRKFFTEMVMIANLVHVPSIGDSVASQYSEGCFATWEPKVSGLIATVTGSARPVEKDAITEDDLAILIGVRGDGSGAIVRHVEQKQNDPPSSESVEMMEMDEQLPYIKLSQSWGIDNKVPVVRSKLHGHRGVSSFDPAFIEFVPLSEPFHHYPVSCSTGAQAEAIVEAFARSEALQNPADPRMAAFTILPGHGLMLVEKWVEGKRAFKYLLDLMDIGALTIASEIPQGTFTYKLNINGFMNISS